MNEHRPLISVVLPVYNAEAFIQESVDSILNQSIEDFELLIIDDASTDQSLEIIKEYKDQRIKVIQKEQNLGLIDSLNLGFRIAKGSYIARMDADDISAPQRFEKQMGFLKTHPEIKAVGCWLQYFGEENKVVRHRQSHSEIQADLLKGNPISMGTAMLVRDAYVDFSFAPEKVHVEDFDFWARSAWTCNLHNLQEVLYFYRVHTKQVSNRYIQTQYESQAGIKLELAKKLEYDQVKFPDEVLSKLWLRHLKLNEREALIIISWFSCLTENNKSSKIFDQNELERVIGELRKRFIFEVFYVPERTTIDFAGRWRILKILSLKDKVRIINSKIKERFKVLSKGSKLKIC